MLTIFRILIIAGISVALSGCELSRGVDLYRPLSRDTAPDLPTVVLKLHRAFPSAKSEDIESSLKALGFSRINLTPITGYEDWANYLVFEDLDRSLRRFPHDPFAWALLANYLALERQPNAAVVATDRTLHILRSVSAANADHVGTDLEALRWTTLLNKAIFLNLDGRGTEALKVLRSVQDFNLSEPLVRLTSLWMRWVSLISVGKPEEVLIEAHRASESGDYELGPTELFDSYDYPQYFRPEKRKAIFDFLRGEALLRMGRPREAQSALEMATSGDSELWAAQLSLGSSYYAQGNYKEAAKIWRSIVSAQPRKGFHSLDLAVFNLANLDLILGRDQSAIAGFQSIVIHATERDRLFKQKLERYLPAEIAAHWRLASDSRLVSEASNNLGVGLLKAGSPRKSSDEIEKVVSLFGKADPDVAAANLARANWLQGKKRDAVDILGQAAGDADSNANIRRALLRYAAGSDDPDITYLALSSYLDSTPTVKSSEQQKSLEQVSDLAKVLLDEERANEISSRAARFLEKPEVQGR